jgi:hypothetical protein
VDDVRFIEIAVLFSTQHWAIVTRDIREKKALEWVYSGFRGLRGILRPFIDSPLIG